MTYQTDAIWFLFASLLLLASCCRGRHFEQCSLQSSVISHCPSPKSPIVEKNRQSTEVQNPLFQHYAVVRAVVANKAVETEMSAVMPYYKPMCLPHSREELQRLCHYLYGLSLKLPLSSGADLHEEKKIREGSIQQQPAAESEEWKQRFVSLNKLREQLKNASVTSDSINEIIKSIKSDDVGEWINFAAAAGGAKIIGSNPETKNRNKAIDGRRSTFLKTDCKADQWLIIELSQAAKVKMIEITMKELYSPRLASITVYGRMTGVSKDTDGYPNKFLTPRWHRMTELQPANRKGTQHFTVISSEWVKYIGLHMTKYHGAGTTCAINDISVYGLSPVDNLHSLLEEAVYDESTEEENTQPRQDSNQRPSEMPPYGNEKKSAQSVGNGQETPKNVTPSVIPLQEGTGSKTDTAQREAEESVEEDSIAKKIKNGDSSVPSVSTFRKMHQDVQSLKGSTTVLSQYVDELHGGLMKTIDELWKAQKTTKGEIGDVNTKLDDLRRSLRQIEGRLEMLVIEQRLSVYRAQMTMGIIGFCISFIGFVALQSSAFSQRSSLFVSTVCVLCCLNFVVSFFNIVTVTRPSFLISISKLKMWNRR